MAFIRFALMLSLIWAAGPALAFESKAQFALMVDDETGAELFADKPDARMSPSSMTKLMTIYIVFDRIKNGTLKMDDTLPVSEKAWRKGGSKMFVELNSRVSIEDLLRGIIVQSGNDACIVVAEGLSGSEEQFAEEMNKTAERLGLTGSHFKNASGWPEEGHYMTARDLVKLSQALIYDFPELYKMFAEREFTYNGIRQYNRNALLGRNLGVDGLKTGHTEEAGYGITVSAEQKGRRITLAINGLDSEKERANEAEKLLLHGFRNYHNVVLGEPDMTVAKAKVWFGTERRVPLVMDKEVKVTLPASGIDMEGVRFVLDYTGPVPAPITKGQHLADLIITSPDLEPITVPLMAGQEVEKLTGFGKVIEAAKTRIYTFLGLEAV